ncbi:MAG: hypothetical protein RL141_499 [Candidatus Parcubacteria bacterium]|jgi:hypothetical protein
MDYRPTLGGLKKAQEFLSSKGHPMPIFQMDIYEDGEHVGTRWVPGKGRVISIDEAIRQYGAMREVVDVRLANEQGDTFVQFSHIARVSVMMGIRAIQDSWGAIPEFYQDEATDRSFIEFMDSPDGTTFLSLARWGKAAPTILDRLTFLFFPKRYARATFA